MTPKDSEDTSTNGGTRGDATKIVTLRDDRGSAKKLLPVLQITNGPEKGRIVALPEAKPFTLGRAKDCDLPLADPSCSRQHAEILVHAESMVSLKDLGSTNGTFVNDVEIKSRPIQLNDGDRIQIGDTIVLRFLMSPESEAAAQMDIYKRATRDPLTNAFNRSSFNEALDRELSYQSRHGDKGLALIMLDVDYFKKVNDSFGHLAGDEVLKELGKRMNQLTRKEDIFARIGGEEFALITRHSSLEGVNVLAERIRESMAAQPVSFEGRAISFTVSVGYTFIPGLKLVSSDLMIQIADEALYEAKNSGRNRCVMKNLR